ncbi:uncharacterized protein LOC118145786 [Callithrix jacchus]
MAAAPQCRPIHVSITFHDNASFSIRLNAAALNPKPPFPPLPFTFFLAVSSTPQLQPPVSTWTKLKIQVLSSSNIRRLARCSAGLMDGLQASCGSYSHGKKGPVPRGKVDKRINPTYCSLQAYCTDRAHLDEGGANSASAESQQEEEGSNCSRMDFSSSQERTSCSSMKHEQHTEKRGTMRTTGHEGRFRKLGLPGSSDLTLLSLDMGTPDPREGPTHLRSHSQPASLCTAYRAHVLPGPHAQSSRGRKGAAWARSTSPAVRSDCPARLGPLTERTTRQGLLRRSRGSKSEALGRRPLKVGVSWRRGASGVPRTGVKGLGPPCASPGAGAPILTDGKSAERPRNQGPHRGVRSVPPRRSGSGPGLCASRPHNPDRGAGTGRAGQAPAGRRGGRSPAGKSFQVPTLLAPQNGADLGPAADSRAPGRGSTSSSSPASSPLAQQRATATSAVNPTTHPHRSRSPSAAEAAPPSARAPERPSARQRGPAQRGRSQQRPRPSRLRAGAGRTPAPLPGPARGAAGANPRVGAQRRPLNADSTSERAGRTMERCGCRRTMAWLGVRNGPSRGGVGLGTRMEGESSVKAWTLSRCPTLVLPPL